MSEKNSRLDNIIRTGLLAAVVFTALAHGAVESWSLALYELMVVALILLWGAKVIADQRVAVRVPTAALPVAALLALALVQSISVSDGAGHRWSLSADVDATRATALALFSLLAALLVAANFFTAKRHLRAMAVFFTIYGLTIALFALAQYFTWNGRFYWVREASAQVTSPFGPFVNRNHFAGYMEMLVPIPLAAVLTRASSKDARLFHLFAATVMAVAAVATLSRGGMISLAAELVFIALMIARRRVTAPARAIALIATLALAVTAGIFWTGSERLMNRMARTGVVSEDPKAETFFMSRGWIWLDTVAMIRANPVLGVGLGAYETAYPVYSREQTAALSSFYVVDRAHNDYLQVLAEGGVIAGALVLWFILAFFRSVFRALKSDDPMNQAAAIGGGAGVFGLLAHSIFDFNLQLPSNALLFLVLAAVVAQAGAAARREIRRPAAAAAPSNEVTYVTGASL